MPRPSPQPTNSLVDLWSQLHDNPDVHNALAPYRLGIPEHLDQNLMLPEPGSNNFFGRHPTISRAIENAFIGVAGMGPTSMSAGDNISNVAHSVLNIPEVRKEHMTSQLMAPFQAAGMISNLQGMRSKQDLEEAQAAEARGKGAYYAGGGRKLAPHFIPTQQGWMKDTGDGPATPIVDAHGDPLMPATHSDPASNLDNRLFYTGFIDPNATPEQRAAARTLHYQRQNEKVQVAGATAQAQGHNLTDTQKAAINTTNVSEGKTLAGISKELGQLTGDVKTRAKYIAAHPEVNPNWTDSQVDQWAESKKQQLAHEYSFRMNALQSYPDELRQNPRLTYQQHIQNLQSKPNLGLPPAPVTGDTNPLVAPGGGGFDPEDYPDANQ